MKMKRLKKEIAALFAGTLLCFSSVAFAAASLPIEVNESYCLNAGDTIERLAIGNPDIADVTMASSTEVLVVGKASGATTLIVWTSGGGRQEYQVRVGTRDSNLEYILGTEMKLSGVHVQRVDKNIMLSGSVTNQYEHNLALKLAGLYAGKDNVVDMIQMTNPSQINIEAQVIEVNESDAKDLGIKYGNLNSALTLNPDGTTTSASATVSNAGVFNFGQSNINSTTGKYWLFNHFSNINATLQALITNGKARVLSRPNMTTMSGETASMLVGGEIPVPVSDENGKISIDWKKYGIQLDIKPAADQDNNITTIVHAIVSRLDSSNAVTLSSTKVPALAKTEATATVNIPSGMTMAIGGLMNTEDSTTITRIPLLSNIPILGELFKHNSTSRDKHEIIILLTPKVVNETTPALMTEKMQETYNEGRKDDQNRKKVDLNNPQKEEEKPVTKQEGKPKSTPAEKVKSAEPENKVQESSEKAAETEVEKGNQPDDSILGKYLNRNVLPKEKSTK